MSGRVSIKGQGADIFFGHDAAKPIEDRDRSSEDEDSDLRDFPLSSPESKPASKMSGQHVSQPASMSASQQDSKPAPSAPKDDVRLGAPTKRRLRELLERDHRTHNTYRYHDDELAAVRAAVLWAVEDYRERGEKSFLVQLLKEGD